MRGASGRVCVAVLLGSEWPRATWRLEMLSVGMWLLAFTFSESQCIARLDSPLNVNPHQRLRVHGPDHIKVEITNALDNASTWVACGGQIRALFVTWSPSLLYHWSLSLLSFSRRAFEAELSDAMHCYIRHIDTLSIPQHCVDRTSSMVKGCCTAAHPSRTESVDNQHSKCTQGCRGWWKIVSTTHSLSATHVIWEGGLHLPIPTIVRLVNSTVSTDSCMLMHAAGQTSLWVRNPSDSDDYASCKIFRRTPQLS